MQAFQNDLAKFEGLNAQVLGVSSDSLETHVRFAEEYNITFPLISDQDKEIKRLYGYGRVTYLIDREGIIRFVQDGVPDNKDFLRELEKLQER